MVYNQGLTTSTNTPWNSLAQRPFAWVELMGWHKKKLLEAMALTASEVGETAAECIDVPPKDEFREELADIALRTIDIAAWFKIDLDQGIEELQPVWRKTTPLENLAELMIAIGQRMNAARKHGQAEQLR